MMQKVHRRKNQQIVKDFICTQGCGKAYGSYAALYTHIKNKHASLRPIDVRPPIKIKATGRKGRPTKQKQDKEEKEKQPDSQLLCKICQDEECLCGEYNSQQDIDRTISVLSDPVFVRFINAIGQLSSSQCVILTRNSEDSPVFMTYNAVQDLLKEWQMEFPQHSLKLSHKWIQYLAFSARFWEPERIHDLYYGIFWLLATKGEDYGQNSNFHEFGIRRAKQWYQFVSSLLAVPNDIQASQSELPMIPISDSASADP